MAENQSDVAVGNDEQEVELPFTLRVEDAGPGKKRLHVEMSGEDVSREFQRQVNLMRQGEYPGFRRGRVPAKLIEKRFGSDIRTGIRARLIEATIEKAMAEHNLELLSPPELEQPGKAEDIVIEEGKAVSFSLVAEVAPEVPTVDLTGLKVRKPRIVVTDEHVDQATRNLCNMQGTLVPVEDRGVQEGDHLQTDVRVLLDGKVIVEQPEMALQARPMRFMTALIQDLPQRLADMRPGETRQVSVRVPDDYPREMYRGKEVTLDITLREIKRLVPAELNESFLDDLGFRSVEELRQALREELQERVDRDIRINMHEQLRRQLLERVPLELPQKLTERQTERVINRRQAYLRSQGIPESEIRENVEKIKAGAAEVAAAELKLSFILDKVAEQLGVTVTEGEVNAAVASMAYREGVRPERLKLDLAARGLLASLETILREEKTLDLLLEKAEVEEVEPSAEDQRSVVPAEQTQQTLQEPPTPPPAGQAQEPAQQQSAGAQPPAAQQEQQPSGEPPAAPA